MCGPQHGHGLLEIWLLTGVEGCLTAFQDDILSHMDVIEVSTEDHSLVCSLHVPGSLTVHGLLLSDSSWTLLWSSPELVEELSAPPHEAAAFLPS